MALDNVHAAKLVLSVSTIRQTGWTTLSQTEGWTGMTDKLMLLSWPVTMLISATSVTLSPLVDRWTDGSSVNNPSGLTDEQTDGPVPTGFDLTSETHDPVIISLSNSTFNKISSFAVAMAKFVERSKVCFSKESSNSLRKKDCLSTRLRASAMRVTFFKDSLTRADLMELTWLDEEDLLIRDLDLLNALLCLSERERVADNCEILSSGSMSLSIGNIPAPDGTSDMVVVLSIQAVEYSKTDFNTSNRGWSHSPNEAKFPSVLQIYCQIPPECQQSKLCTDAIQPNILWQVQDLNCHFWEGE